MLIGTAAAGALACSTWSRPQAPGSDAERTISQLRAQNAGSAKRVEELENRILVLERQGESRRLASEQREHLQPPAERASGEAVPVAPATDQLEPAVSADDGGATSETSILAEQGVDYGGEAAQQIGGAKRARPLLRLSGSGSSERWALVARPLSMQAHGRVPRIYRSAREAFLAGQFSTALWRFQRFLENNPEHPYADDAQYWIGQCHSAQHRYRQAEKAFRAVSRRFPRGDKVPDALLKLGLSLQMRGEEVRGRAVLVSLTRAFPKHEAARLATARLTHASRTSPARPAQPVLGMMIAGPLVPLGSGRSGPAAARELKR